MFFQKNKGGAQTAFDTAASAFKNKVVGTNQRRKKNRSQLDADERPLSSPAELEFTSSQEWRESLFSATDGLEQKVFKWPNSLH